MRATRFSLVILNEMHESHLTSHANISGYYFVNVNHFDSKSLLCNLFLSLSLIRQVLLIRKTGVQSGSRIVHTRLMASSKKDVTNSKLFYLKFNEIYILSQCYSEEI